MEWHDPAVLFSVGVPVGMAWTGALLAAIRVLVQRSIGTLDQKQSSTEAKVDNLDQELRRIERELLELKAALPLEYYRREDMIRFETVMHAKLDGLARNIQAMECRKCPTS